MAKLEHSLGEIKIHKANIRRGKFTLLSASAIAREVRDVENSDPFAYDRTIHRLMTGLATPEDYTDYLKRADLRREEIASRELSPQQKTAIQAYFNRTRG